MWAALLASVKQNNAAAWLDLFTLRAIDTTRQPAEAAITPASGAAHARRFATAPRLDRLGQRLGELVGLPVRVRVADATPPDPLGGSESQTSDDASSSAYGAGGGVDRRAALDLPLVRDALEVFPDAVLLDARRDTPDEPPAPGEEG